MLELELKKYKSRYNSLFPLKDTKENFIKVFNLFKGKEIPNKCLFICSSNHINITFLSLLMLRGDKPKFEKFNTYDFIDIYLQRREDYTSLAQIHPEVIGITNGLAELPNNQLINYTRYVLNRDSIKDIWFYQIGRDYPMESMLKQEGFYIMYLDSLFGKPKIIPDNSYKYKGKYSITKENTDTYNKYGSNKESTYTNKNVYTDDLF